MVTRRGVVCFLHRAYRFNHVMIKTSVNHNQENNFVLIVTHFLFLNPGAVLTFLHVHRQFLLLLLFALYVLGQNFLELGSLLLAHLELLFKSTNCQARWPVNMGWTQEQNQTGSQG